VRRATSERTPWIHRLLTHLHEHGFDGAPRPLGIDDDGREILTYIEGETRRGAEPSDEALVEVMRLVRRFHDLTAELVDGEECAVHGDLSPRNTIYRDGRPVALIDWDGVEPGRRIRDVSRACWQFVEHGEGVDPALAARRWRLMADAYGLEDRSTLVVEIIDRLDENADGIEARAAGGSAPHQRLVELGAPSHIRAVRDWAVTNRDALERGVGAHPN
jgi:tRNA A-37 threonylcarbamoyl transferase component Bud32